MVSRFRSFGVRDLARDIIPHFFRREAGRRARWMGREGADRGGWRGAGRRNVAIVASIQFHLPMANWILETLEIGNTSTLATFTAVRRNLHRRHLGLRPAARLDAGNRYHRASTIAQLDPSDGIRADEHFSKRNSFRRHSQSWHGKNH